MTEYERIDDSPGHDRARVSHEARYSLAGSFTTDSDVVVDAACGTGYGKRFLRGEWVGVDREPLGTIAADLQTWTPDFGFDVFVGLETIEHLADYAHYVEVAQSARKWIVISTPIVPTKHRNPFHVHDFTTEDIKALFAVGPWSLFAEYRQLDLYGLWVFKRGHDTDWTPQLVWRAP